jgi:hypothetical protein
MISLIGIAGNSSAAIYKWQDENGGWHFSEVPPDQHTAQKINVRVTPPSDDNVIAPPASSKSATNPAASAPPETPIAKSPEEAREDHARRKHNCQVARENLPRLQQSHRIRFKDKESGQERYLSEEERNKWIADSQKAVKENCN